MKKILLSFLLLSASFLLGIGLGMNEKNVEKTKNAICYSVEYMEFDDLLENADVILSGTVKEIVKGDAYDEYYVEVCSVEKGIVDSQIVIRNIPCSYVYEYNGEECCANSNMNYQENRDYLFILQHIESVYENAYYILGDVYIPLENTKESTYLSRAIEKADNVVSYIEDYTYETMENIGNNLTIPYTKSNEMIDIVTESMYIVLVKPDILYHSTDIIDVYLCDVLGNIKGNPTTTENKQIIVSFFKDTVNIEHEYIVCLNTDTSDSLIYALSSINSVMEPVQEGMIKELLREVQNEE